MDRKRQKLTPGRIMNNRYPQTPDMIPPPGLRRDYPYGPTLMPTSNPLYPSGVGFAPNMFTSQYPSTAFTSGNCFNSSYPASSSPYLLAPNNSYPVFTSTYPASSNDIYPVTLSYPTSSNIPYPASAFPVFTSPYPASSNDIYPVFSLSYPTSSNIPYPASAFPVFTSPYPASSNDIYPVFSLSYPTSSNIPYPASALPYLVSSNNAYADSSNSRYFTSCNCPYPAPTLAFPYNSNRHYPASNSSYPAPPLMNQTPGPSKRSRDYDSKFGPSVNESNDDAIGINSLPDEIIEEVFGYLTQNQLGQIARVCRRWNMLTKSPVLWRKVNVKIFSFDGEENTVAKSFINGLPSCVTFIRLDFSGREDLDFEELCVKLHQNCPHVEELTLVHCAISNILPEVINFCTKFLQCVKKLVLNYCHFSNCSRTVEINDNSKIEVLDLYGCYLFHFSKKQFSKLLYLKELRLADTNANDSWFVDNSSFLNQLHVLDLGWTSITASTFLLIQRHGHNLKELYLCNSILEDHDLDFNNSVFPHLRTMCLSATYVTCEDVVSLMQSSPSLENVYVYEDVSKSLAEHPFVVANRYKSGIVKAINWDHNHDVDYSHN